MKITNRKVINNSKKLKARKRKLNSSSDVLTICPNCGGHRFNARTGLCIDCGYDEKAYGDIYDDGYDDYDDYVYSNRTYHKSKNKKSVKCNNQKWPYPEGHDGYLYVTKHGIGPGTLPKGVKLLDWEDLDNNLTAIWVDRFLTTKELNEYDIYPETQLSRFFY